MYCCHSTALAEPSKPLTFIRSLTISETPLFLCALSNIREVSALMSVRHFTSLLHQVNHNLFCFCRCHAPQRKAQPVRMRQWREAVRKALRVCVLCPIMHCEHKTIQTNSEKIFCFGTKQNSPEETGESTLNMLENWYAVCQTILNHHFTFSQLHINIPWECRWPVLPALIRQLLPVQIYL